VLGERRLARLDVVPSFVDHVIKPGGAAAKSDASDCVGDPMRSADDLPSKVPRYTDPVPVVFGNCRRS